MLSVSDFSTAVTRIREYYGIANMPLAITPQAALIYADGGMCMTPEIALGTTDGEQLRSLAAQISDEDWLSCTS